MTKAFHKLLLIGFFFALLVSCYAIYSNHFTLYSWSSITLVPILLTYGFSITNISHIQIYYYILMIISWGADFITLSSNRSFFYIGLSLYSFSYMLLGGILFKALKNDSHKNFPEIYYLFSIVLSIIIFMITYNSSLSDKMIYLQYIIHIIILVSMTYWSLKLKNKKVFKSYFIPAVILILISNLLYGIDQLVLHRTHSIIDALVVFLYGIYLLFITKGITFYKPID